MTLLRVRRDLQSSGDEFVVELLRRQPPRERLRAPCPGDLVSVPYRAARSWRALPQSHQTLGRFQREELALAPACFL